MWFRAYGLEWNSGLRWVYERSKQAARMPFCATEIQKGTLRNNNIRNPKEDNVRNPKE